MYIKQDIFLGDFDFWSGATFTARFLTKEDFIEIENALEECYPEGLTDVEINDIFRWEEDFIAEILGYSDFDELVKERAKDEDEDEDEDEERGVDCV